jgi:hypothetical protein
MFGMFTVKKKINTPAEERLEEIKNILFPPSSVREKYDEQKDKSIKYQIDYSIDMNLDSAIIDIQNGLADKPVINTLNDTLDRLYRVRELLEAHAQIDKDAEYIIVETLRNDSEIEDIEASEI